MTGARAEQLVSTVAGEIPVGALGVTYMHEHVFVVNPELQWYWPGYAGWDEDREVARAREALHRLRDEYGCRTLVDPTVPGLGRNIRAVARAAAGTRVNVVAATGWYAYRELPFAFSTKDLDGKIETLLGLFLSDVEHGMEGTDVKPGIIKCASDVHGVTPDVEAVLRAAARTHVQTGLPLTTHTHAPSQGGLDQQRIFREEGVDLGAVVIGHCNESDDLGYLERLIDAGSYIGFDRCGLERRGAPEIPSLDAQLANLAELVGRGYAGRIVLSHDHMCFLDLRTRAELDARGPAYSYLHERLLPGLRERGVSEREITQMLVDNPREYFSRRGAEGRRTAAAGAGRAAG